LKRNYFSSKKRRGEGMMKRKSLRNVLVCLMLMAMTVSLFSACGNTPASGGASSEDSAPASEDAGLEDSIPASEDTSSEDSLGAITFILSWRDEWLSEMEEAAITEAKELGVSLTTVDAQNDTSKMLQFIETARNDGQKAVIINMVDPETAAQCVEAAGDMYVVFVNRYPADASVLNERVAYVGSDENKSGSFQGEWLAEHFKAEGKTEIKYILLNGIMGQTSTTLRTESVLKSLEENGITATEATSPLAAEYTREMAQDMIAPLLNTIEYDCIISNNDAMALGAIEALSAEGIDPTTVTVVGIDASTDGRQAIREGKLDMSVFQDPKGQGRGAMLAAENLVEGKAINENSDYELDETGYIMWIPFETVTADNVAEYDAR